MQATRTSKKTEALVLTAILTAIVGVLSYFGGFIKIGGLASISLTLIPVVLGAALLGPKTGAWLGAVSGAIFFLTPDAAFWLSLHAFGTVLTVLLKGALAGLAAGLVYRLLEKKNRYLAVLAAAAICPLVNTALFLVGCLVFFFGAVVEMASAAGSSVFSYLIVVFVGLNFVFELALNLIVSPAILRLLELGKKTFNK
ncbi:MAG: ECF transporter S component [Clostridia bacterium]|nr:ECF transporter S component [Clostridia bacterium]